MAEDGVKLSDLITHTANELRLARSSVTDPVMQLKSCDIELDVKIELKGEAGLKIYVVKATAGVKQENTSKIKLSFEALKEIPSQFVQEVDDDIGPTA